MSFASQDDLYMPCLLKPAGCQGQRVQLPVGCMVQYPPGMPNSHSTAPQCSPPQCVKV